MADPVDFSNVKLLLHCDGGDTATTFADSSTSGRTVTAHGGAQLDTAQFKWGGASGLFDGNGDYLTVPHSADFDFGTGDWTVELWYRPAALDIQRALIGKVGAPGFYPFRIRVNATGYVLGYCTDGSATYITPDAGPAVSVGAWSHIAFVRRSNLITLYVDGVATGSPVSMGAALFTNSAPLCIGSYGADFAAGSGAGSCAYGHIDDLRIIKGEAMYSGDFTPPSAPFPDFVAGSAGHLAAAGPLAGASLVGLVWPIGLLSAPGVLGAVEILGEVQPVGQISASGPLAQAHIFISHDFTGILDAVGAVDFYVCDLVDDAGTTRAPISSWQGTLQLDGSCYLQAVVPAAADFVAIINALGTGAEFVISRCARLPDGAVVVNEMARSPIEQLQFDQGPQRFTCTLSGYSGAMTAPEGEGPPLRVLRGLRSVSSGTSGVRVRCAIDWFLRPGAAALAGDVVLIPDWISYYVGGGDAYMDAGERA